MIEFFDRAGGEAAFCQDGQSLYLWTGRAVAFIHDDKLFAYDGRFIGWVDRGWISDTDGACLLFEHDAVGGPEKPKRRAKTTPGPRGAKPSRAAPQDAPPRPVASPVWSDQMFADLV